VFHIGGGVSSDPLMYKRNMQTKGTLLLPDYLPIPFTRCVVIALPQHTRHHLFAMSSTTSLLSHHLHRQPDISAWYQCISPIAQNGPGTFPRIHTSGAQVGAQGGTHPGAKTANQKQTKGQWPMKWQQQKVNKSKSRQKAMKGLQHKVYESRRSETRANKR
jgi:hypothetical protein